MGSLIKRVTANGRSHSIWGGVSLVSSLLFSSKLIVLPSYHSITPPSFFRCSVFVVGQHRERREEKREDAAPILIHLLSCRCSPVALLNRTSSLVYRPSPERPRVSMALHAPILPQSRRQVNLSLIRRPFVCFCPLSPMHSIHSIHFLSSSIHFSSIIIRFP